MREKKSGNPNIRHARGIGVLAALSLLAFVFAVSANDDEYRGDFAPSLSPDGMRVVYYSYRGKPGDLPDLFIYNRQAGEEQQLTNTSDLWEIEPKWSADGSTIYFSGGSSMKTLSLEAISPGGGDRKTVDTGNTDGPVNWSSDGRYIAGRTPYDDSGNSELVIYEPATGKVKIVSTGLQGKNMGPNWSPDGRSLVFKHTPAGQTKGTEVYRIPIDGGDPEPLTHNDLTEYKVSWSLDANTIYFMAATEGGLSHIYRVSAHGGASVRMTADGDAHAYFPELSPDGKVIFFSDSIESGKTRIMMLPAGAHDQTATLLEHELNQ